MAKWYGYDIRSYDGNTNQNGPDNWYETYWTRWNYHGWTKLHSTAAQRIWLLSKCTEHSTGWLQRNLWLPRQLQHCHRKCCGWSFNLEEEKSLKLHHEDTISIRDVLSQDHYLLYHLEIPKCCVTLRNKESQLNLPDWHIAEQDRTLAG